MTVLLSWVTSKNMPRNKVFLWFFLWCFIQRLIRTIQLQYTASGDTYIIPWMTNPPLNENTPRWKNKSAFHWYFIVLSAAVEFLTFLFFSVGRWRICPCVMMFTSEVPRAHAHIILYQHCTFFRSQRLTAAFIMTEIFVCHVMHNWKPEVLENLRSVLKFFWFCGTVKHYTHTCK